MDATMRDLDQIREREDSGSVRKLALWSLGGIVVLTTLYASSSLLYGTAKPKPAERDLVDLELAAAREAPRAAPEEGTEAPTVSREGLTFPYDLTSADVRPEVEQALAAAAAEEAHPDPVPGQSAGLAAAAVLPSSAQTAPSIAAAQAPVSMVSPTLPASMAAGPGQEVLARVAGHDPLLRNSLQERDDSAPSPASPGTDGVYTLQVSSVPNAAAARTLAEQLRARGHRAFIVEAMIPGRGKHYRVRIGPFQGMAQAEGYRRDFEASENMNTYIVRRELAE